MRDRLRGVEAKGVNIVNLMLFEDPVRAWRLNEWGKRLNTFEHDSLFDLAALAKLQPLSAIENLMAFGAVVAASAPWPQVRAVAEALALPLTTEEKVTLLPFLKWPRDDA